MTTPTPVLTPKSAIGDIIAKLEGATGPDRAIDRLIAVWVFPRLTGLKPSDLGGWHDPEYGLVSPPSPYTDSLDASLALVEEKLPGWTTDVHTMPPESVTYPIRKDMRFYDDGSCEVELFYCHPKIEPREIGSGFHQSSPPLAVLIALFRALDDGASSRPTGQIREEPK